VGSVCFRPVSASGAATPSPIFRILDRFRGTLILDGADFKDSSAWVEMGKVLNNGYTHILRIRCYGVREGLVSKNQHGVTEAVEAILLSYGFLISFTYEFSTGKGGNQHQER